jgi:hypothetical protein
LLIAASGVPLVCSISLFTGIDPPVRPVFPKAAVFALIVITTVTVYNVFARAFIETFREYALTGWIRLAASLVR